MAIDQGTTSSRAIVFNQSGKIKGIGQKEFEQIFPEPGWVEHDPMEIWSSQLGVIHEALDNAGIDAGDLAAIRNYQPERNCYYRGTGKQVNRSAMQLYGRTAGPLPFVMK